MKLDYCEDRYRNSRRKDPVNLYICSYSLFQAMSVVYDTCYNRATPVVHMALLKNIDILVLLIL